MYSSMYRIRRFEETMLEQTFKGNAMGVTHPSDGQEAGPVGICAHLTDSDWIGSTLRGHGHCIAKGLETRPRRTIDEKIHHVATAFAAQVAEATLEISTKLGKFVN